MPSYRLLKQKKTYLPITFSFHLFHVIGKNSARLYISRILECDSIWFCSKMFVLRLNILILFSNIVIYLLVPMDLVFLFYDLLVHFFHFIPCLHLLSGFFLLFLLYTEREMYFITFYVNTLKYSRLFFSFEFMPVAFILYCF